MENNNVKILDSNLGNIIKQNLEQQQEIAKLRKMLSEGQTINQPISHKQHDTEFGENYYNRCKKNGIPKATAAEAIRSYDDFKLMQNYFLQKKDYRDWCLWTVGVGTGLRVSDLLSLKYKHILNDDMTFRDRIIIYEIKTGKVNNILLTEGVKLAFIQYIKYRKKNINLEHYIFESRKGGGKTPMTSEQGWRIIAYAGKELKLPFHVGSHTMRKSFASIVACSDKNTIDYNTITKVQGLLNHSDQRTTMKYLGALNEMYDRARLTVSDFIMGKSQNGKLSLFNQSTLDNIYNKIEELENIIYERQNDVAEN